MYGALRFITFVCMQGHDLLEYLPEDEAAQSLARCAVGIAMPVLSMLVTRAVGEPVWLPVLLAAAVVPVAVDGVTAVSTAASACWSVLPVSAGSAAAMVSRGHLALSEALQL